MSSRSTGFGMPSASASRCYRGLHLARVGRAGGRTQPGAVVAVAALSQATCPGPPWLASPCLTPPQSSSTRFDSARSLWSPTIQYSVFTTLVSWFFSCLRPHASSSVCVPRQASAAFELGASSFRLQTSPVPKASSVLGVMVSCARPGVPVAR